MSRKFTRKTLPRELAACNQWPTPDISQLLKDEQLRFAKYKEMIEAYLGGAKVAERLSAYGIAYADLLRQLNRCVAHDKSGHLIGWHALLPYQRVKTYERMAPLRQREICSKGGYTGALGKLFALNPDIQAKLDKYLLTGKRDGAAPESRVTPAAAHSYFLALCGDHGICSPSWPFSVDSRGKTSLWRYTSRFWDEHYDEIAVAQYGQKAKAKSNTGTGRPSRLQANLPFDVVELDEHSVHFIGCIGVPTCKGIKWVPLRRLSIIVLADRHSRAILSYGVIIRQEPTDQDILSVVARALSPWQAREMAVPGFELKTATGMPSALISELAHCGFNLLLVDNHLSHLAEAVLTRLIDMAGCAVNYGQTGHFERRPHIEGIFHRLEELGFVRLPSTTGTDSQDERRRDAEDAATKHCITLDAMLDLIEALIADYNARPGAGNFSSSPLDQLRSDLGDSDLGFMPPWVPPRLAHEPALDTTIETGRVGGNRTKGVRPHIYLDRVRYTNHVLSSRWDLLGKTVVKHIREDNIQSFIAYTDKGECLGEVHALGNWGLEPHSRAVRREINKMLDSGAITEIRGESPVTTLLTLLGRKVAAKALKGKPKISRDAQVLAEEERRGNTTVSELDTADTTAARAPLPREASEEAKRRALTPMHTFKAIN
ncbi:hypothetical protein [Rhodanobacter sp. DHG33]|uniref:hypothetical protein n=1 Tax=Rhodanobacter sp. DHG33 TaxID=2775921 RepID=UPI0017864446|nr:hypothetical protein [Rhodanobacter sp. DHG33]MBD8898550.1 hypothetical protein [Rhodanobacter sp. DHG33]